MSNPGSPKSEDNGSSELLLRQYDRDSLNAWIKKMKLKNDGVKQVPPLEIIEFEDLIPRAWNPTRLVPWSCAIVLFKDYMDYLKSFFRKSSALHCDPRAAAEQCLEMEKMYVENANVHEDNLSLETVDVAEKIKNEGKYEGDSAVVAAGLVCITAEAELMPKLLKTDMKMFKLSNDIRVCALRLMTYKGPESDAIAGVMLGISHEARKVHRLLYQENAKSQLQTSARKKEDAKNVAKLQVCLSVRRKTLCFMDQLKQCFISGSTVNSDVNALVKPKRELNGDKDDSLVENERKKKTRND